MKDEGRQAISMILLAVALALFILFHFSTGFGRDRWGWAIWPVLWGEIRNWRDLDWITGVGMASFLNLLVLIVVAPFLKGVWLKSLWAWWGAVIFSGLAAAVFLMMFLIAALVRHPYDPGWGMGGWCLLVAPIFNFVGLRLARGGKATEYPRR